MRLFASVFILILSLVTVSAYAGGGVWGNDESSAGSGIWGNDYGSGNMFDRPTDNTELPEDNTSDGLMGDDNPVPSGEGFYITACLISAYALFALWQWRYRRVKKE